MNKSIKSYFYLLAFNILPLSAQWSDSFTDSDFGNDPEWTGDTSHFEINLNKQLHLKAPSVSGKSYLVTASEVSTPASWKFRVQLDFNPSSGNYAKVYLISDNSELDTALHGYYLKIGSTDDDVSLYRQDGLTSKLLIDGRDGMLSASVNKLAIQVNRSLEDEWSIQCDTSGGTDYSTLGKTIDSTYFSSGFFGIQCIYTSTRSDKFQFDDFDVTGQTFVDTILPKLVNYKIQDGTLLFLEFSEAVDRSSATTKINYILSPGFNINTVEVKDEKTVLLLFSSVIPCKQKAEVKISGLMDISGNYISDTTLLISYCTGNTFDVLITEIMADPDPPVKLPNVEYLELYNKSGVSLNLENWVLQVGDDLINIPSINFPADSFMLITTASGCKALDMPNLCVGILPTNCLNNEGEYVGLRNQKGELIHWFNYDEDCYHDDLKNSGGWSLEMGDTGNPCEGPENWNASTDYRGGSPRKINPFISSTQNGVPFQPTHIFMPDDFTIRLHFSKPLNSEDIDASMFSIDPSIGSPFKMEVDSLQHLFVDLFYKDAFQENVSYLLNVSSDISDCSGNDISATSEIPFMVSSPISPNDLIINEILFDAMPDGYEFVELYNNSNKYINSEDLRIAYRGTDDQYSATYKLGSYPFLIAPKTFIVVTRNPDGLNYLYHLSNARALVEVKSFPALNNEEGCVALKNTSLETLDEFCYSKEMHYPLLTDKSGVSLERIRYNSPTNNPDNWHSASYKEGYATPGYENSQFLDETDTETELAIQDEIFSPDNDGYKDVEIIHYKLDQPDYAANIIVFDAMGRRIKILANNKLLGIEGSFTWNGIDEKGQLAPTGIYLIYAELHLVSGKVKHFKRTCVLAGELKR